MAEYRSAGGVVVGPDGRIVIVNQNNDSWSLPKGHLDPGESAELAAKREIYEEAGIAQLELIKELGTYIRPQIGKGGHGDHPTRMKKITLFLFTTNQKALRPIDPANPKAKWVEVDEVTGYLTHRLDIKFFESIIPDITSFLRTKA